MKTKMAGTDQIQELAAKLAATGITREEVAEAAHDYTPNISMVLRGKRRASVAKMDALHAAFQAVARQKIERLQQALGPATGEHHEYHEQDAEPETSTRQAVEPRVRRL